MNDYDIYRIIIIVEGEKNKIAVKLCKMILIKLLK